MLKNSIGLGRSYLGGLSIEYCMDTTYLLPLIGISINGIPDDVVLKLLREFIILSLLNHVFLAEKLLGELWVNINYHGWF